MSDPSERFAETFACGCSVEQGQWFVCARHLDEQAQREADERWLRDLMDSYPSDQG